MRSYQKILHLGDPVGDRLLVGNVNIEEKIDGSLIRIQINPDGTLEFGSKRVDFNTSGTEKNFSKGVEIATELINKCSYKPYPPYPHTLNIFGEYLATPKQNTLGYERVPKNHIMVFDMVLSDPITQIWMDYPAKKAICDEIGFECVPSLYQGDGSNINQDFINKLLETKSVLGNELIEGVVIKNMGQYYDITKYPWLTGFWMAGKYVRKEFQERNSGEHAGEKSGIDGLKVSFGGAARWNKAIYRLRDEGKLENNMRDMKILLEEVKNDIVIEEKENIKEELWKLYNRTILSSSIHGLAEFYQQKLLETL